MRMLMNISVSHSISVCVTEETSEAEDHIILNQNPKQ